MDASSSFLCGTCAIREQASRQSLAETVPEDVLALVFRRLNNVDDFLSFGAVCRRLHGISTKHRTEFMTKLFPWLVIQNSLGHFAIFSGVPNHSTRTIHDFVKVRDIDPKFECCGSSLGWLIAVKRESTYTWRGNRKMRLLNPVSGQQLSLPDFSVSNRDLPFPFSSKFVLSSNPSSSSSATGTTCFVAAAAYGRRPLGMDKYFPLAFAPVHGGGHEWNRIEYNTFCDDIIFIKDKLYGITAPFGTILCVEDMDEAAAGRSEARVTEIVTLPANEYHPAGSCYYYLAESQGNLLAMERFGNQGRLHIYQLILACVGDNNVTTLNQVYSLNDQVLFIGKNSCISLPASSSNSSLKNCIYLSVDGNGGRKHTEIVVISTEEGITIPLDDGEIPSPILPQLSRHRLKGHQSDYIYKQMSPEGKLFMPFWLTPIM